MPDTRSEVQIIFSGKAQNLEAALHQVQADLAGFGARADKAGARAGEQLASGERRAAHEASLLGERTRVAAEMVGLLGAESSEQVLKVEGLSSAFRQAQHAFGGFSGAIAATAGSFALFRGLDFLHSSVDEAMQGEAAWARLSAAYAGNAQALAQVRTQIEGASESWAALGMSQARVADLAARARGRGLDVSAILGDPQALADTAAALGPGTGIAGALDAIASPRAGRQVLAHLGLSVEQLRQATQQMQYMTAARRAAFIEQQVEASRFKGVGTAFEQTDAGKLLKFHTMMQNLQEEVGTALLPAILQLVEAMTSLLQGAEKAAQPFGGLANVLKTLFVPMLGAGLLLFTNLRGVMTRLVDVLLGRLVGAFAQTAGSMAGADAEARTLSTDIGAIPELVTTTADFVPATAIKDAYKANIASIPREWTTTAAFVPASVAAPAGAAMSVPVEPVVASDWARSVTGIRTRLVSDLKWAGIPSALVADDKALAQQAQQIRTRAATDLARGGPIPVKVRAQWVGDAASGLRTGLAVGAAAALTDVIFNSVTIKHVTFPAAPAAPVAAAAAAPGALARSVSISGTPHVYVTNLGALGPALVGPAAKGAGAPGPAGAPPLAHSVSIAGVPTVKLDRTTPIQGTISLPGTINVHARQSGGWQVSLSPDAFARFGQMVGEIALGVMIGNVLQGLLNKIPFGKVVEALRGLFRGPGGKGGGGGKEEPQIPLLPQFSQSTLEQMVGDLLKGEGVPLERSLVPVPKGSVPGASPPSSSTFLVSGLTDALRSIHWSAILKAAGFAAGIAGAIGGALVAVVGGVGKVLGTFVGPTAASAETTAEAKRLGLDKKKTQALQQSMAGALGDIAAAILGGLGDAIKRGMIGLENIFLSFFNAIVDKVKSAPIIGGLFKGLKDIPLIPIPAPPKQATGASRLAGAPPGGAVVNTFAGLPTTPRGTRTSLTIPGYGRDIERGNVYGVGAGRPVRLPAGGIYDPTHSTTYEAAIDLPGGKVLDIMHIKNTLGTKQRTLAAGTTIGTALDFTNLKGYQASALAGPRLTKEYVSEAGAVEVGLYKSAQQAWARNAGGDLDIGAFLSGGRGQGAGGRTAGKSSGGGRSGFGGAVPLPAAVHPVLSPAAALHPGRAAAVHPAPPAAPHPAPHPALHPAVHHALGPVPRAALAAVVHPGLHGLAPVALHAPAAMPAAIHPAAHAAILPAVHQAVHQAVHAAAHVALAVPAALHRTLAQPLPAPAAHAAHAAVAALAARLAPMTPAPAHASRLSPLASAAAPAHQTSHNTYNATFNIHDATDANAVARQVNRAFSEFVQGVRSSRRLHG